MKRSIKCVGALVALSACSSTVPFTARPAVSTTVQQGRVYRIFAVGAEDEERLVGISTSAWIRVAVEGQEYWINLDRLAESKARDYMDAAYVAEMISDLHNVAIAEEAYFADNIRYVTDLNALRFTPRRNVTLTVDAVDDNGYRATARHRLMLAVCAMWVGSGGDGTFSDHDFRDDGRPVCR